MKFRFKIYFKYFLINLISLISIIFTFFLFKFFSLKTIINLVKRLSLFFTNNFKERIGFRSIFFLSNKMNEILGIQSCFKICISQKIVLSIFGFNAEVVCGIKSSTSKPLDGHAWIVYKGKPILKDNEIIEKYIKSFII